MPVAIPPLVGRADETAHLHGLLRSAAAGAGGLAVITGEPGVGKTRLVEAAATAAAAAGMQVRIGRGVDREVERTLGVALDALGMRLDQLVGVSAATRFVLEAGTTAASAFLLADRLLEVVEGLCTTGPMLLAVEDLQWSDTATLAWLRAIAERAAALALAVFVTTRPVADGTEVGRTLDALGAPVVAVAPLADDEVSALATGVLGHRPDPALRAALDEARGNPLLVLAVLERGDGPLGGAGTAALTRRLAELDAAALRTVQFAAVLGLRVDLAALATVVGGLPNHLLTHVEAAAASGVLVPDGDHYVFRHDLYRAAVLSTVTRPARSMLHLHAARSLARASAPVLDVAEHYAQGARPGDREAVRWLHHAAVDIVTVAPAGALRLVDVALDLAGPAPPDDLVLVRVRALAGTGRTAEADLLGRSLLRDGLEATTEALLRRELGFTALMRGHAAECVTEIERCAELTAAPGARARVYGELAFARFMVLDHAGARAAAEHAVRGGERHGDLVPQVAGDAVLCFLDLYGNRVADAVRRARDIVDRAQLPRAADAHVFQPWFIACLVHLETDRLDLLTTTARRGREVAVERGTGWAVPGYDAVAAFGALRAGAFDDAAATAGAALGYLDGVDGLGVAVWCHAFLAQVLLYHDDVDAAEAHVATAERWLTRERAQLGFEQV